MFVGLLPPYFMYTTRSTRQISPRGDPTSPSVLLFLFIARASSDRIKFRFSPVNTLHKARIPLLPFTFESDPDLPLSLQPPPGPCLLPICVASESLAEFPPSDKVICCAHLAVTGHGSGWPCLAAGSGVRATGTSESTHTTHAPTTLTPYELPNE